MRILCSISLSILLAAAGLPAPAAESVATAPSTTVAARPTEAPDDAAATAPDPAADVAPAPAYATIVPSDPCYFFRAQAHRKGLHHYATEMLWVCQMMAQLRGAKLPLSDRLLATEAAFEDYRARYFDMLQTWYQDHSGASPFEIELNDNVRREIAEDSGVLLVLELVKDGF